jgi:hypothetical protein
VKIAIGYFALYYAVFKCWEHAYLDLCFILLQILDDVMCTSTRAFGNVNGAFLFPFHTLPTKKKKDKKKEGRPSALSLPRPPVPRHR